MLEYEELNVVRYGFTARARALLASDKHDQHAHG